MMHPPSSSPAPSSTTSTPVSNPFQQQYQPTALSSIATTVQPLQSSPSPPSPPQLVATPSQVENALSVLQSGDIRVAQADAFLTHVASCPSVWHLLSTLIRSSSTSPAALRFAANTLLSRLRADWLSFPHNFTRHDAISLAITGAAQAPLNGPLHAFGTACGFALALCDPDLQKDACWNAITQSPITAHPTRHCFVLAAIALEAQRVATAFPDNSHYSRLSQFLASRSSPVITPALSVLHNSSPVDVVELRAAISCVSAWLSYAEPSSIGAIASGLACAIATPGAAADAADALAEVVGYSATPPGLVAAVCGALVETHRASDSPLVRHAIAEVACSVSDGNADDLIDPEMYKNNSDARLAIAAETQLLAATLADDSDEKPFFAAVDGWGNWISADTVAGRLVLPDHQLSAVVSRVVCHIANMSIVTALAPPTPSSVLNSGLSYDMDGDWEDLSEYASEIASLRDLLLASCTALGIPKYLEAASTLVLSSIATQPQHDSLLLSTLFSVLVAGDVNAELDDVPAIESVVFAIIRLLQHGNQQFCRTPEVRRLGFASLSAHVPLVVRSNSSTPVVDDVIRLAVAEIYSSSSSVNQSSNGRVQAAQLFELISERTPHKLVPLLPELVHMASSKSFWETIGVAAGFFTHALGQAASILPTTDARLKIICGVTTVPCEEVDKLWSYWGMGDEQNIKAQKQQFCRWIDIINFALRGVNDDKVRAQLFARVRRSVGDISLKCASNGMIARVVCRFLETCAQPTLTDEGESLNLEALNLQTQLKLDNPEAQALPDMQGQGQNGGDLQHQNTPRRPRQPFTPEVNIDVKGKECGNVVKECIALASQCFERSGPSGESCWIRCVREIWEHLPMAGVSHGYSIESTFRAASAFCEGHLSNHSELIAAVLSLAAVVAPPLHLDAAVMAVHVLSTPTESPGINSPNLNLARAALSALAHVDVECINVVGGAHNIVAAVLSVPLKTRSIAGIAVDVLFNLGKYPPGQVQDTEGNHGTFPSVAIGGTGLLRRAASTVPMNRTAVNVEPSCSPLVASTSANCDHNGSRENVTTIASPSLLSNKQYGVPITNQSSEGSGNGHKPDTKQNLANLLALAFLNPLVPRAGLDAQVKHALFSKCVAALGSKIELRKALEHVSRVCTMRQ